MNPRQVLKQFGKFGLVGIGPSVIIIIAVLSISFPVFSDKRLLISLFAIAIPGFIILYIYYLRTMNNRIVRFLDKLGDPETYKKLEKSFRKTGSKIFYDNMLLMVAIFFPYVFIAYRFFGYDNLYYHFYLLFIAIFLILYFGYFTLNIWYVRTYPLGKFGIPVSPQRLRSKIVTLIQPVVLIVTVIISILIYFTIGRITKEEINKRITDNLQFCAENTLSVSEAIEKVNTGSKDFVERSGKLTESSSQLREIAVGLSKILKRFKLS